MDGAWKYWLWRAWCRSTLGVELRIIWRGGLKGLLSRELGFMDSFHGCFLICGVGVVVASIGVGFDCW